MWDFTFTEEGVMGRFIYRRCRRIFSSVGVWTRRFMFSFFFLLLNCLDLILVVSSCQLILTTCALFSLDYFCLFYVGFFPLFVLSALVILSSLPASLLLCSAVSRLLISLCLRLPLICLSDQAGYWAPFPFPRYI